MPRWGWMEDGGAQARKRIPPTCSPAVPVERRGTDMPVHEHVPALGLEPLGPDLDPLDGAVHEARRAARPGLLAEHRPGLERVADLDRDPADLQPPHHRAAELDERAVGLARQPDPAGLEEGQDLLHVAPEPEGQQEAVVQLGAPADQPVRVGLLGEGGHERPGQDGLGRRHARVGRHLEGAQLDEPLAPVRAPPVEELVDGDLGAVAVAGDVHEQVAEQPVAQPGRGRLGAVGQARERDLQLVERVVAGLVDPGGLRGRPDEEPGEEVGERRVVLDEGDQARRAGRGGR